MQLCVRVSYELVFSHALRLVVRFTTIDDHTYSGLFDSRAAGTRGCVACVSSWTEGLGTAVVGLMQGYRVRATLRTLRTSTIQHAARLWKCGKLGTSQLVSIATPAGQPAAKTWGGSLRCLAQLPLDHCPRPTCTCISLHWGCD
jgi:hypothetical protein